MNHTATISNKPADVGPISYTGIPRTSLPIGNTIAEMIATHAQAEPQTPAIVFDGRVVTYGEMDRRAEIQLHRRQHRHRNGRAFGTGRLQKRSLPFV